MSGFKQLQGISNVEINKEDGELFIEDSECGGIVVELNIHELMHLLNEFTDEEWSVSDIYGRPETLDDF